MPCEVDLSLLHNLMECDACPAFGDLEEMPSKPSKRGMLPSTTTVTTGEAVANEPVELGVFKLHSLSL